MSIRPIDMQVLIPRATEVGVQQNNLAQQSTIQQQQFAEQLSKAAEVRQQQVQGITKGQGGKIERDGQKAKNHKRDAEQPGHSNSAAVAETPEAETETASRDPVLGYIIDIKT